MGPILKTALFTLVVPGSFAVLIPLLIAYSLNKSEWVPVRTRCNSLPLTW